MLSITKILCGLSSYGDELRYKEGASPAGRKPIVVWNSTRRCNLNCIHCYSDSGNKDYAGELTTQEAKEMIQGLAEFKVPVLLFSGGEPLMRQDIFELNALAKGFNMRRVISTNGTLITRRLAKRIKEAGFDYVGVSLDGISRNNDRFRGRKGAFKAALAGIRNLVAAGQKAGLRFTITKHNYPDMPAIFELIEKEGLSRACFYHLVYSGRGSSIVTDDLPNLQMRQCIDSICDWAVSMHERGIEKEVLTVDNHADSAYIYLKLKEKDPERAKRAMELLKVNGGNASGMAIANIDNLGNVHADQFWQSYSFGNIRERKFGDIWSGLSNETMRRLKDRKVYLKGKCSCCRFLDICNGNFRVRAEAAYGDIWEEDPACYLTAGEIRGVN